MISSASSFSYQALRVNFEFVRIQSDAVQSPAATDPAVSDPAAVETQPAPVPVEALEQDDESRRMLDAASEAGRRAGVRHDDDDDDHERRDHGAAPGSVREARRLGRAIGQEVRPYLRGNSGVDRETRHELRSALHDLRHDLRDAASAASGEDGAFDVEAFATQAATAIEGFAAEFAAAFGIDLSEDEDPAEVPTDEGPVVDVVDEPTRRVEEPAPTVVPGA